MTDSLTPEQTLSRWDRQRRLPDQADVDTLRELLDLMANFSDNDQRARFLLSSNWMRDRRSGAPNAQPLRGSRESPDNSSPAG